MHRIQLAAGLLRRSCAMVAAAGVFIFTGATCPTPQPGPSPSPSPLPCDATAPSRAVAFGVTYYDCTGREPEAHIVTVDRAVPDYELWLLDDPVSRPVSTGPQGAGQSLNHQTVEDFARNQGYNALVAVNGQIWDSATLIPISSTFETGLRMTNNTGTGQGCTGICDEDLFGVSQGLDVRRIDSTAAGQPGTLQYQYNAYGTYSSVLENGQCNTFNYQDHWSVLGYSDRQIVMLVNRHPKHQHELCSTLAAFGVTDAVMNDGGGSAQMDIRPLSLGFDWGRLGLSIRKVAYGMGVVQLHRRLLVNAGFEEPALASGEAWRRLSAVTGWTGPVDLHAGWDLAARGSQIVDLNQNGAGYLQAQVQLPASTYCLLQFAHGLNYHCASRASFDVLVDGQAAGSFTSTIDPNCAPKGCLKDERVRFKSSPGGTTTLRFNSTTPGCGAATIDDVSISCTAP